MRSITTFDLQYAHRFYGFQGEAQYLHGHTGVLTIEVEETINEGVNMVYPCNEIQKVAWEVLNISTMPWYSARMIRYYLPYLTYMRNKVLKTAIRKTR